MPSSYEQNTVSELREKARLRGINKKVDNFWKLKKAELIVLLRNTKKSKNYIATSQKRRVNELGLRK
jgi:hypothetical protein